MPRVSVIIPNYNHAKFLEQRIDSVLNQTFQNFEVIILDDASTDNSREVFSRFADDPRLKFIFNETNSGSVFKQWNKGFKESTGEYIWIAESDDYADEHFLETLVAKMDANITAGVGYCQSWMVDENGNRLQLIEANRPHLDKNRWLSDFISTGKNEVQEYMIFESIILNASATLIRREVVERVGYADCTFKVSGDWLFWMRMLLVSDLVFVANPLNFWRYHAGTVRRSTLRNGIMIMENYKVLASIASSTELDHSYLEKARERRFQSWICYSEDGKFGLRQNRMIYEVASQFDPHICRRILAYLPLAPIRLVGRPLLRKFKHWKKHCRH